MSKYTEADMQALAALMDFGSTGSPSDVRKPISGATNYLPSDKEQFDRLMTFDGTDSERATAHGKHNPPVRPPRTGDHQKTEGSYTADDQQSFDRIIIGIEDNSTFKSPKRPRPAAEVVGPKYEASDIRAFAALGGEPAEQDEKPTTMPEINAAPRYTPPQRPNPKDYFGIKVVDADAERGKERLYFSAERPAMKIVFSDVVGKKWRPSK